MAESFDYRALMIRHLAADMRERGFTVTSFDVTADEQRAYDALMGEVQAELAKPDPDPRKKRKQ